MEGAPDSTDAVVAALDRGAFEGRRDGVAGRVEQELGFLEDRGRGEVADADLFRAAVGCVRGGWGVRECVSVSMEEEGREDCTVESPEEGMLVVALDAIDDDFDLRVPPRQIDDESAGQKVSDPAVAAEVFRVGEDEFAARAGEGGGGCGLF